MLKINSRVSALVAPVFVLLATLSVTSANAQVNVELPAAGSGPLQGLTDFLQDIIDFMAGPWAYFVLGGGLILAVCLWIYSPRENGAMSWFFRAIFGGVMLLNIGGLMGWIASWAT